MDEKLDRLEAVTSRLESFLTRLTPSSSSSSSNLSNGNHEEANNVDQLPIVRDYETLINESVKPFLAASNKIGGDLTTMAEHVRVLFEAQQVFVKRAVQSQKPNESSIIEAIKPQSKAIESITGPRKNDLRSMIVTFSPRFHQRQS